MTARGLVALLLVSMLLGPVLSVHAQGPHPRDAGASPTPASGPLALPAHDAPHTFSSFDGTLEMHKDQDRPKVAATRPYEIATPDVCAFPCGPMHVVASGETDDEELTDLLPQNGRSPYPAGDWNGDQAEDVYLLDFIDFDGEREATHVSVLSGTDGGLLWDRTFNGSWVQPWATYATPDGAVALLSVQQEAFFIKDGETTWVIFASTLFAVDARSGAELWSLRRDAHVAEDDSGWMDVDSLIWGADFVDSDVQSLRWSGRFTWTDRISAGEILDERLSIVQLRDLSPHYAIDPTGPRPVLAVPGATGTDVLARQANGTITMHRGLDYQVLWEHSAKSPAESTPDLRLVRHDGADALLRIDRMQPAGVALEMIGLNGTTRWVRDHLAPTASYAVFGTGSATPDSQLMFFDWTRNCDRALVELAFGRIDLRAGDVLWSREVTIDISLPTAFQFSFGAGDASGDGIADPFLWTLRMNRTALFGSYDPCQGGGWFFVLEEHQELAFQYFDSANGGDVAAFADADARPLYAVLPWWTPDAAVTAIPFVEWRHARAVVDILTIRLHRYAPAEGTWSVDWVDARTKNPFWNVSYGSLLQVPLNVWSGPFDTVLIWRYTRDEYWGPNDMLVESHEHFSVYVHDIASGARVWAHETEAPLDTHIPGLMPAEIDLLY